MKQEKLKILFNKHLGNLYHELSISSDYMSRVSRPGQFVHIRCSDGNIPLLRRPFSIHNVSKEKGTFEILYEVLGEGTEFLSKKKSGDFLDIIGPLGAGFNYQLPIIPNAVAQRSYTSGSRSYTKAVATFGTTHHSPVLIAGGMGVAPLLFLAELLVTSYGLRVTVLIGAKTKNQILCEKEFKQLGCDVKIATEDGSLGFRGIVTDLLRKELITHNSSLITGIYSCGPRPMLKEVSKIAKQHKIKCQVSLEELIACGVGVCLGCAVNTKSGYKLVCKDGPVFSSDEIIWG